MLIRLFCKDFHYVTNFNSCTINYTYIYVRLVTFRNVDLKRRIHSLDKQTIKLKNVENIFKF